MNLLALVTLVAISLTSGGCVTRMNTREINGPSGYERTDKSWSTSPFASLGEGRSRSTQLFHLEIGGGGHVPAYGYGYPGGYSYGGGYGMYSYIPNRHVEVQQYRNTMRAYGVDGHNRPPAQHQLGPQQHPQPPRGGYGGGQGGSRYGYGR
jgi:hypothetical protein